MMEGLKPQFIILVSLAGKPKTFTEIMNETGLSSGTISKWLKVHLALGNITLNGNKYGLTNVGYDYVRSVIQDIISYALDYGIANRIQLATIPRFTVSKEDDDYVVKMNHYGEYNSVEVLVSLGDEAEDIVDGLKKLIEDIKQSIR